jgi:capsular exopolysaccharide synthesis family protein
MSQIFDALLRAETERGGTDPAAQAEATELLRSVESQVTLPWTVAVAEDERGEADTDHRSIPDRMPEQMAVLARPDSFDMQGAVRDSWLTERPSIWGQFQSVAIAPAAEGRLVSLAEQTDPTSEAFRLLGVRLKDLRQTRPLDKLLITSTVPQEGKSTVAANVACTMAHISGEKTLLVEGDIRRPSLSQIFHLGGKAGICEWLREERGLAECIYQVEGANIWILPAGKAAATPLELMQSKRLPILMNQLTALFHWVIVDSPPILPLADTSIWTRMVDGILLVTRRGITEKKQLERGLRALDPAKVIGALMNCSQVSSYSSYYYKMPANS